MNACLAGFASRRTPRLSRRLPHLCLTLLAFTACDSGVTEPPRVTSLTRQAGTNQTAEVGTTLPAPLVVEVHDVAGVPIEGIVVRFESEAGGTEPRSAKSDALGRAWVWWQLGVKVGPQLIIATVVQPDAPQPVQFSAHALPGPPAQIVVARGLNIVAVPGAELDTLVVHVTDRFTNPVPVAAVTWSIESGGGIVRGLGELSDSQGRAKALWKLGSGPGTQSIIVAAGSATRRIAVSPVPALVAQQVVAGSDHSCALTADGSAYCWGSNAFGQLGIGARDWEPHPLPAQVATGVRFKSLTLGAVHTCGLALDGTTWCWGDNRARQTADQDIAPDVIATPLRSAAPKFTMLSAGGFHTCGLTSSGAAYCWGDDSQGQLGRASNRSSPEWYFYFGQGTPVAVAGSLAFKSIAASLSATCGVTTGGVSYCWGANDLRFLARDVQQKCRLIGLDGFEEAVEFDAECSTSPVAVATRHAVSTLAVDQHGVCALLTTSELECWGRYLPGPMLVPGARLSTAWASDAATCGLDASDKVSCWNTYPPFNEVKPHGDLALVDISTSGRHTCGLARGVVSTAYCWGTNFSGEIGDGTKTHRAFPVAVVWPYAAVPSGNR